MCPCTEACEPENGESFREREQVRSLLIAVRNAVPASDPTRRLPTAAAALAAEAAAAALHPAAGAYTRSR